jgi:sugar phosphate isomerase/epimerase
LAGFVDLLDGDQPWKETFAALRAIGYDATVVAEMIPWNEGLLQRTKKAMDKIWAMGAESGKA